MKKKKKKKKKRIYSAFSSVVVSSIRTINTAFTVGTRINRSEQSVYNKTSRHKTRLIGPILSLNLSDFCLTHLTQCLSDTSLFGKYNYSKSTIRTSSAISKVCEYPAQDAEQTAELSSIISLIGKMSST